MSAGDQGSGDQGSDDQDADDQDADDTGLGANGPVGPAADVDTLITDDAAKLPQPWPRVVDVGLPLPTSVAFFEKRVVLFDLLKTIVIAAGLALAGIVVLPIGVGSLWSSRGTMVDHSSDWWLIGFGVVLLFSAWVMWASLATSWRILRRQSRGDPTRLGVFVGKDGILEATAVGFCLIPRPCFVGLSGHTLSYTLKGQPKTIKLPTRLVRDDPHALRTAIQRWAGIS